MPIHDWTRVYAGIFHDFHHEWITTIKHALNQGVLPPDYYALAEQAAGGLHPDVLALERNLPSSPAAGGNGPSETPLSNGGIALAVAPPCVRFTAAAEEEVYARKRNRIAIHHISDDRVVALIEIVSPGNKASRHALRAFIEKSVEFLDAGIHLLVLDLFPPGSRDPPDKLLTLVSYSAGYVKRAFIEPVAVADELPPMPLFLEAEVYVLVPLEATYRRAFAAVPKRWQDELTLSRPD